MSRLCPTEIDLADHPDVDDFRISLRAIGLLVLMEQWSRARGRDGNIAVIRARKLGGSKREFTPLLAAGWIEERNAGEAFYIRIFEAPEPEQKRRGRPANGHKNGHNGHRNGQNGTHSEPISDGKPASFGGENAGNAPDTETELFAAANNSSVLSPDVSGEIGDSGAENVPENASDVDDSRARETFNVNVETLNDNVNDSQESGRESLDTSLPVDVSVSSNVNVGVPEAQKEPINSAKAAPRKRQTAQDEGIYTFSLSDPDRRDAIYRAMSMADDHDSAARYGQLWDLAITSRQFDTASDLLHTWGLAVQALEKAKKRAEPPSNLGAYLDRVLVRFLRGKGVDIPESLAERAVVNAGVIAYRQHTRAQDEETAP